MVHSDISNHWREGEGHQRSNHDDEVQDVPQVSEVGAIMENQTLVNHLEQDKRDSNYENPQSPREQKYNFLQSLSV